MPKNSLRKKLIPCPTSLTISDISRTRARVFSPLLWSQRDLRLVNAAGLLRTQSGV